MNPEATFLLQYIGIFLTVTGLLMALRRKTTLEVFHELFHSRFVIYMMGMILMWIALFIVMTNWAPGSVEEVLLNVVGFLMFIEASLYIILPRKTFIHLYDSIKRPWVFYSTTCTYFVFGLALTWIAFFG